MTDYGKYPPQRGHAWRGDWKARLLDLVRQRGFSTITEFVAATPTRTLLELSNDLGGGDVAPIQIQWALVDEAKERGELQLCARDLLVRRLNEVADGWPSERSFDAQDDVRDRLIAWEGALRDERYDAVLEQIRDAMLDADDVPAGWRPAGVDDPVIAGFFEKHWPRA